MNRVFASVTYLSLVIITSGCGGSKNGPIQIGIEKPPDQAKVARVRSLYEDYLNALNSSTAKINQVVDKDSAMTAAEELKKSAKLFGELAKELKSMGKFTKGEDAQLSSNMGQSVNPKTASENFGKAAKGLTPKYKDLPPEAVKALGEAFQDFSKANMEFSEASRALAP